MPKLHMILHTLFVNGVHTYLTFVELKILPILYIFYSVFCIMNIVQNTNFY